jgi:signal transduction histidine kinase
LTLLIINTDTCLAFAAQTNLHNNLLNAIFLLLVVIVISVFFLLREQRIKQQYIKLEKELGERIRLINEQEKEIIKQKLQLQKQINLSDKQNEVIHIQTMELEKNRHQLEKTVELRTQELKFAKEKAEESDRLKTAFLENISHEIRTPMNAIIGFASLLSALDISNHEREKYIARINKNCQVLLHLINDILDMSALQANQMVISKNEFSVDQILQDIYNETALELKELGLENIKLELVPNKNGRNFTVYSDPFRFKQVLRNLLGNATKYTEKGFIRFGYVPLFDSNYDSEPSMLQFYVEDSGIGISQEKSDYIFQWFNKIDENPTKIYRGAGLGLYISRELVQLMGGKIWFNSKPYEGSTFYFTLPYFDTSETKVKKPRKKASVKTEHKRSFDWRKKVILIVEDEQNNFIYLSEIVKRNGANVLEARDGIQAVKLVKENPTISVVLMDLMIPEMNGYETTKKIKELRPNLPVIAQTAYTNAREKERSLEAGCDGYISKPFNPPELFELIDTFI